MARIGDEEVIAAVRRALVPIVQFSEVRPDVAAMSVEVLGESGGAVRAWRSGDQVDTECRLFGLPMLTAVPVVLLLGAAVCYLGFHYLPGRSGVVVGYFGLFTCWITIGNVRAAVLIRERLRITIDHLWPPGSSRADATAGADDRIVDAIRREVACVADRFTVTADEETKFIQVICRAGIAVRAHAQGASIVPDARLFGLPLAVGTVLGGALGIAGLIGSLFVSGGPGFAVAAIGLLIGWSTFNTARAVVKIRDRVGSVARRFWCSGPRAAR